MQQSMSVYVGVCVSECLSRSHSLSTYTYVRAYVFDLVIKHMYSDYQTHVPAIYTVWSM